MVSTFISPLFVYLDYNKADLPHPIRLDKKGSEGNMVLVDCTWDISISLSLFIHSFIFYLFSDIYLANSGVRITFHIVGVAVSILVTVFVLIKRRPGWWRFTTFSGIVVGGAQFYVFAKDARMKLFLSPLLLLWNLHFFFFFKLISVMQINSVQILLRVKTI